jgi:hypothetical protein
VLQLPTQLVGRRRVYLVGGEVAVDRLFYCDNLSAGESDWVPTPNREDLIDLRNPRGSVSRKQSKAKVSRMASMSRAASASR